MDAIVGIPYTFTSREMLQPLWLIETKGDLDGVMSRKSVALASSNQLKRNRPMPDAYGCNDKSGNRLQRNFDEGNEQENRAIQLKFQENTFDCS